MSNEIYKVLMVAFLDDSRVAAYKITTHLKEYGYSVDLCHAPPEVDENDEKQDLDTRLQADLYFNKATDLSMYNGIVFLDDGGDPVVSKFLAKRANEEDKALGGYAFGVEVLHLAGLLKDKYVPVNIPPEWAKGNKLVNAPSVRCDNIVLSAGACTVGFTMLFADALGGKVKRKIESVSEDATPLAEASLVIAPIEKWAEYWTLAEKLARNKTTLLIANLEDVDLESKTVKKAVAIGPHIEESVAFLDIPFFIPKNIWLRQAADIATVEALEEIGCTNINSSESIRLAGDKLALANILGLDILSFDNADTATETLIASGTRWIKSADNKMMIQGRGNTALISNSFGSNSYKIVDKSTLTSIVKELGNIIVKKDAGISIGGRLYNLCFAMRRNGDEWVSVLETARSEEMICPAAQFMAFAEMRGLEAAREKAREACKTFHQALKNKDEVNELEVSIGFNDKTPQISDITAITSDVSFAAFIKVANALGMPIPTTPAMPDNSFTEEKMQAKPDEQQWYKTIERELGCQGIWMQRDGRFAVSDAEGTDIKSGPELIKVLKGDMKYFLQKFNEFDQADARQARMYSRLVRDAVLKLRLLKEFMTINATTKNASFVGMQKTADYADEGREYDYNKGTIPGPFSNVSTPARVLPWIDEDSPGDGSDIDDETIKRLDRYHPSSKNGFSNEFDLWHKNDPTAWEDYIDGESIYPSRANLMR